MHTIEGNQIDAYAATALHEFVAALLAIRASAMTLQEDGTEAMNAQQHDCLKVIITSTERLLGYMSPEYNISNISNGSVTTEIVLDRIISGRIFPPLLEDRTLSNPSQQPRPSTHSTVGMLNLAAPTITAPNGMIPSGMIPSSMEPSIIEFVHEEEPFAAVEPARYEKEQNEKERNLQRWNDDGSVTIIDVLEDVVSERKEGLKNLFQVSRLTTHKRATKRVQTRRAKLIVKEKPNVELVTQ